MTKLNHYRPQLVYNDNRRRELKKSSHAVDHIEQHHRHLSNLTPNEKPPPKFMQRFERLDPAKQAIVGNLLECWNAEVAAFSEFLPTIMSKKKQSKSKAAALAVARERLAESGAIFMCEALEEIANGEDGVWSWLTSLRKGRDVHFQFLMSDLQEFLFEVSLPLCTEWAEQNLPTLSKALERISETAK